MLDERILDARILVVDDEEANIQLLRRVLEPAGFRNLVATTDPEAALELLEEQRPDLVLLDLLMPGMDGFEFLDALQDRIPENEYLPVLVLTSDHTSEAKRRALSGGARDFLTKPLSPAEVRLRVRNLLETRMLHRTLHRQNELLEDQNVLLEERVRERTSELEDARIDILHRLARAAEYRDDATGEHTRRVARTSAAIAECLGLENDEVELIRMGAPLHDVGKIGVPDRILLSPRGLTPDEFELMKSHTTIGAELLGGSEFPLMEVAARIALSHHEHWDGTGYPHGRSGDDIPLPGRIVAVADTWDALTHARPYKPAWSTEEAWREIEANRGAHFDPDVVDAFRESVLERRSVGASVA